MDKPTLSNENEKSEVVSSSDQQDNDNSDTTYQLERLSLEQTASSEETNDYATEGETEDSEKTIPLSEQPSNEDSVSKTLETVPEATTTESTSDKIQNYTKLIEFADNRIAPKVDCPEKIVFCIDMSSDMNESPFDLGNGGLFSPLCVVKRTVEIFMLNKLKINGKHEFAVMGFHNTAVWVVNFTSDIKKISAALDQLYEMNICEDSALPSVFKSISVVAAELPTFQRAEIVPPPFVFRVILIYGRSRCLPENEKVGKVLSKLKDSPYFFLDILYIHETASQENMCQEIFDRLCDFDEKGTSYIFEVGRNMTKLHNCMAKLLAHPLQRPLQRKAYYKLRG